MSVVDCGRHPSFLGLAFQWEPSKLQSRIAGRCTLRAHSVRPTFFTVSPTHAHAILVLDGGARPGKITRERPPRRCSPPLPRRFPRKLVLLGRPEFLTNAALRPRPLPAPPRPNPPLNSVTMLSNDLAALIGFGCEAVLWGTSPPSPSRDRCRYRFAYGLINFSRTRYRVIHGSFHRVQHPAPPPLQGAPPEAQHSHLSRQLLTLWVMHSALRARIQPLLPDAGEYTTPLPYLASCPHRLTDHNAPRRKRLALNTSQMRPCPSSGPIS